MPWYIMHLSWSIPFSGDPLSQTANKYHNLAVSALGAVTWWVDSWTIWRCHFSWEFQKFPVSKQQAHSVLTTAFHDCWVCFFVFVFVFFEDQVASLAMNWNWNDYFWLMRVQCLWLFHKLLPSVTITVIVVISEYLGVGFAALLYISFEWIKTALFCCP